MCEVVQDQDFLCVHVVGTWWPWPSGEVGEVGKVEGEVGKVEGEVGRVEVEAGKVEGEVGKVEGEVRKEGDAGGGIKQDG